jgi:hypothetical protein
LSQPKRRKGDADAVCSAEQTAIHGIIQMENTVKNQVCSMDELYKAVGKCRRNVAWKDSVVNYSRRRIHNSRVLHESLMNGTYEISKYSIFYVYEPKKRKIVSTRMKDRVFQRSLCDNYLYHEITKHFIYDNCACQRGKGTKFARDRLKVHIMKFYRKHGLNGNALKMDLSNYFGSTRHDVASKAVHKRAHDPWACGEVDRIIISFNDGENPEIGLGLGSEVTQLIELAVLDDLDHYIKEQLHIKHYVRYMDDLIIIHEDKDYLRRCQMLITEKLTEIGLQVNKKKTQIFPLTQRIKFLGFSYELKDTGKIIMRVLPKKISHERRKLKKLVERANAGIMTREDVDKCFASWKAHAMQGNTYNLVQRMEAYYQSLWR